MSNFATKTAPTNLSNTVPDISTLIKKSDHDTKIAEIENKYVSNSGFDSKLAQANVITKRNFDAKIVEIENNINKFKTFDSSYFRGKSHFEEDDVQNYLVFQPIPRYCKTLPNTTNDIASWKSKGLSTETIKPPTTSDNSLAPTLSYSDKKNKIQIDRKLFKTDKNLIH